MEVIVMIICGIVGVIMAPFVVGAAIKMALGMNRRGPGGRRRRR